MPDADGIDAGNRSLVQAVEEFLAARRRGEDPGIEAFAAARGGLADALRETLPGLLLLERLSEPLDPPETGPAEWPFAFGDFRVIREIGRGGMGIVYEAEQVSLRRRVALKILPEARFPDVERRLRFRREAEAAARLDHPGICGVLAAGIEQGTAWIAMRFIEGETLARRLAWRESPDSATAVDLSRSGAPAGSRLNPRRMPPSAGSRSEPETWEFAGIVEGVARALHVAHEAGIIHRDVKPGNIMLAPDGRPVLLDFGLAKIVEPGEEATVLTRTGDVFGTPAYMAPEQVAPRPGQPPGRTADVWSLGVTLHECLAGHRPFAGPTRQALADAILNAGAPPVTTAAGPPPRALRIILATALQKDPACRYQTALDLAEDLRRARAGEPILARPPAIWTLPWRWARRRPWQASLAAACLLALVLAGSFAGYFLATRPKVDAAEAAARLELIDRLLLEAYFERAEGDSTAAARTFEAALELDPAGEVAAAGLALTLHEQRDWRGALSALARLDHAGDSAPHLDRFRSVLEAAIDSGQPAVIRPWSGDGVPEGPAAALFEAELILSRCEKITPDLAIQAFNFAQLAQLQAPRARPIFLQTLAHAAYHVPIAAARKLTAAVLEKRGAVSPELAYYHARLLASLDRLADAEAVLRRALTPPPGAARLQRELGIVLKKRGDTEGARKIFEALAKSNPASWTDLSLLASTRLALGDGPGAAEASRWLLDIPGASADALDKAAQVLAAEGAGDSALPALQRAVEQSPSESDLHVVLGKAFRRVGRNLDAEAEFREAGRLDPNSFEAHADLADLLQKSGRIAEAVDAWNDALRAFPDSPVAHNNLGVALLGRGEPEAALVRFHEAARLRPEDAEFQKNIAATCHRLGRYREALAAAQRSVALGTPGGAARGIAERDLPAFREKARAEERLEAWLAGEDQEATPKEWIGRVRMLAEKSAHFAAARTAAAALRSSMEATPAEQAELHLRAAASALAAGAGLASDGGWRPADERKEALTRAWAALEAAEALLAAPHPPTELLRNTRAMAAALSAQPVFARARDAEPLASLPEAVRAACAEFWRRLATLGESAEDLLDARD